MDLVALIGRFHPVVLHLPIGALFTIAVAEFWLWRSNHRKDHSLLFVFYLFAFATGLMAVITGLILHEEDVYGGATLDLHKQLGIRRITLLVSLVIMSAAGHYGAELTHGKGYLTEFAPAFLRGEEAPAPVEVTEDTTVFTAAIEPILKNYCVYCHDADNTKGGLRMDTPELMLAGGTSGPLFVAGDTKRSLIIRRMNLPPEHDGHMPPINKRQPNEEEKAALTWWVEAGASFEMKMNDAQVPEYVRSLIPAPVSTEVKSEPKGELDMDAVQNLRDQFLTIQRISQGEDRLWVDFSAIAHTTDDAFIEQLAPLSEHVVWLNLSRTAITDQSMTTIRSMENLEELDLRNCNITDEGLAQLQGLPHLKKLNLIGTRTSEDSVDVIEDLPSLEVLDLFQSEWSMHGYARLREANPNLTINFGE